MQYFSIPRPPSGKTLLFTFLTALAVSVTALALTAQPPSTLPPPIPHTPPPPALQVPADAGLTEHRLTLSTGQTVTCLTAAAPPALDCDWRGFPNHFPAGIGQAGKPL